MYILYYFLILLSLALWDREADPFSNQVKVYISVIRRKLQAVTDEEIIRSIRGAGYLIDKEEPL